MLRGGAFLKPRIWWFLAKNSLFCVHETKSQQKKNTTKIWRSQLETTLVSKKVSKWNLETTLVSRKLTTFQIAT